MYILERENFLEYFENIILFNRNLEVIGVIKRERFKEENGCEDK